MQKLPTTSRKAYIIRAVLSTLTDCYLFGDNIQKTIKDNFILWGCLSFRELERLKSQAKANANKLLNLQ